MELIVLTKPQSVLDVGVGFGKYGVMSREFLELWDGRENYTEWTRTIDGIEVFKGYLTPLHDFIYDKIYVGNAIEIIPTLKTNYDIILLIDVLEHLDYEAGIKLLKDCQKIGKNIIVSTPHDIGDQKDSFGNPFEIHKFQWRKKHFHQFKNKFFIPNELSLICYIGKDSARIKNTFFIIE